MHLNETATRAAEAIRQGFSGSDHSITAIVDLATLVANADGVIDEAEFEALAVWLSTLLEESLGPDGVRSLVRSSLAVIRGAGPDARIRLIADALRSCNVVDEALLLALAVGYASDGLSAPEKGVIEDIARAAYAPAGRVDELARVVAASLGAP